MGDFLLLVANGGLYPFSAIAVVVGYLKRRKGRKALGWFVAAGVLFIIAAVSQTFARLMFSGMRGAITG